MKKNKNKCMECACRHFTNKEKTFLFCVKMTTLFRNGFLPECAETCNGFEVAEGEKLVLTPAFLKVLKLLRGCM